MGSLQRLGLADPGTTISPQGVAFLLRQAELSESNAGSVQLVIVHPVRKIAAEAVQLKPSQLQPQ